MKDGLSQVEVDGLVVVKRLVVKPTVWGVGFNDVAIKTRHNGLDLWQYTMWKNILQRCYSEKYQVNFPTYVGISLCDDWHCFSNFLEWVNKEVGYKGKPVGFALDKDLLMKGNRKYSPEACSFVPEEVNSILLFSRARKGSLPIGVSEYRKLKCFRAGLSVEGKARHIGYYDNPEEAFQAYKVAKEAQIKVVALQHKDVLKPAVFESLMNWVVADECY